LWMREMKCIRIVGTMLQMERAIDSFHEIPFHVFAINHYDC
jgi:hypothetical protein